MPEGKRYLNTGAVVESAETKPGTQFVVLNPYPPGSISQISYDNNNIECLNIPGTPAEGVENLIVTGVYWTVERTVDALKHALRISEELELVIRQRYELPPYEMQE
ncbi:MAG TPA: hypothetical protein VLG16_00320 [Candidatus Saccharimonadales bacterium]|nr:hypothetical protein [Candidatus Saccharimonadales bacterium]